MMLVMSVSVCFLPVGLADADDHDILMRYAPVLYFESSETCYPVDVSYMVDNSVLYMVSDPASVIISSNPTLESLGAYTSDVYYLDNTKGTVDDDGIINDYKSKQSQLGYTVYGRVVSVSQGTILQYWFFYVFNKGELNRHEGDWEMVQILLKNNEPVEAMYSQHHSGQRAEWSQVEKDGDHFKVYVARGSHANYFRSYSGRFTAASDIVGDNGLKLTVNDYRLELLSNQSWLSYSGRWGWFGSNVDSAVESVILGRAGPEGPRFREDGEMWDSPLSWGSDLPMVNDVFLMIEWVLYNFIMIMILVLLVSLLILGVRIYLRYKRHGLGPRILSLLYIDGFNLKSIGNILALVSIIIAILGLYTPWYNVRLSLDLPSYKTIEMMDVISVDGWQGLRVYLPSSNGPTPVTSFSLPFSLFILIGLVLLIVSTIGVHESKKLGRRFIGRGIRLMTPFIVMIIIVMLLGLVVSMFAPSDTGASEMNQIVESIASSPLNGEEKVDVPSVSGVINVKWGCGIGLYLLLISGLLFIIAGILLVISNQMFYELKKDKSVMIDDKTKIENVK
ncbi:MAG: hypothetical protein QXS02_03400 [Candidatus Thermoplasmatota archaeon]